jgi:hypothetical protein
MGIKEPILDGNVSVHSVLQHVALTGWCLRAAQSPTSLFIHPGLCKNYHACLYGDAVNLMVGRLQRSKASPSSQFAHLQLRTSNMAGFLILSSTVSLLSYSKAATYIRAGATRQRYHQGLLFSKDFICKRRLNIFN